MTREEEIHNAYKEHLLSEGMPKNGFEYGAEWADEHPKNPWRKVSDEHPNDYYWVVAMVYHDDESSLIMLDYILPNGKWGLNPQYTYTHWMPIPELTNED